MRLSLPNFALLTLLVFSNASAAVAAAAATATTAKVVPTISSSSLSPMDAYHFGTTIVQRLQRTGRQLTATTNQAASHHQASSQSVKVRLYGEQQQQQHRRLAEVPPENDLSFIAPKTKPTTSSTTAATFALVPRTLKDESSSPMDSHHTTMHSAPVLQFSLDPQGQRRRRRLTAVEAPKPFQAQPIFSTVPRTTTTAAAAASNDKDEDATSSPSDAFHATLVSSPHLRRGRRLAQAGPSLVQDSASSSSLFSPMDAWHWHHWLSWSTTAATRTTTTTAGETEPPTMQPPRDDHLRRHSAGPILAAAPAASDRTATVSTLDQRTDATHATATTTTVRTVHTTRLLTVRDAWPALSQLHWSTIAIVLVCGALGVVALFAVVFAMIYDLLGCCAKNQDDDDTDRKSCHPQRKSWFHQNGDPTEDHTSANEEDCDELEDDHTDCGFVTEQAVMGLPPGVDPRLYHGRRPGCHGSHPQCDTHHATLPRAIAVKRRSTHQRKPWLPDIESLPPPASGRLSLPAIDEAEIFDSVVDETRPTIVPVAAPRDHTASTTTTPPLFSNLFQLVSALERAHGLQELNEDSSVVSSDSSVLSAPRPYGGDASILSASSSNVSPLVLFATNSTVGGHGDDDEDTTNTLGLPSNTDSDNHSRASTPSLVVRVPLDSETSSRASLASCGEEISAASTVEYHLELSAHQRAAWEEFQRQSSSSPSSNDSDHNCVNDDERSEQRKRARSALSLAVQSDLRHIVGRHVPIKLILGEQVEI
jgi:hypothetical protein